MALNAFIIFLHHLADDVPAALITGAIGILMACGLACSCTPCRAKDALFKREVF